MFGMLWRVFLPSTRAAKKGSSPLICRQLISCWWRSMSVASVTASVRVAVGLSSASQSVVWGASLSEEDTLLSSFFKLTKFYLISGATKQFWPLLGRGNLYWNHIVWSSIASITVVCAIALEFDMTQGIIVMLLLHLTPSFVFLFLTIALLLTLPVFFLAFASVFVYVVLFCLADPAVLSLAGNVKFFC